MISNLSNASYKPIQFIRYVFPYVLYFFLFLFLQLYFLPLSFSFKGKKRDHVKGNLIQEKLSLDPSSSNLSSKPLFHREAQPIQASLSKIGDSSHIEWTGRKYWSYKIEKLGLKRISITLPRLSEKTVKKLLQWKDSIIQKIKIKKSHVEDTHKVIFHFRKKGVKVFDYSIDSSSLLITDFYVQTRKKKGVLRGASKKKKAVSLKRKKRLRLGKKSPQKTQYKKLKRKNKKKKNQKILKSQMNFKKKNKVQMAERLPAGSEFLMISEDGDEMSLTPSEISLRRGVFDGSDPLFKRFSIKDYEIKEESIISSRKNIYIKFPLLHMRTSRLDELLNEPPQYRIKRAKVEGNEGAFFLLKLFEKKKFFSFLRFYDYFIRRYPKSHYDEIVRNMALEVYFRLWKKNGNKLDYSHFRSLSRYLIKNYPKSSLTRRASLMSAYSALENRDALEAIQKLQEIIKGDPHFVLVGELKQSLAEAFLFIDRYEDALSIYKSMRQNITKNKNPTKTQVKSVYFIGDVYLRQEKYEQAVLNYKKALTFYPKYKYVFPNAFYNLAESLFWLGYYKESLSYHVQYLKYFPSHSHGSYAMTRVGEILEILGADDNQVKGVFMESAFRFEGSPGADIAKIRMASRNMEEMKEKEVKKALKEMNNISKRSKLPRVSEFASLMIADGLYRRKAYKESLDYLIDFYYRNPTTVNFTPFKKRILRNISDLIKKRLDKREFIESLKIFKTYDTNWLREDDRFDIPFFLAKSYEFAGASQAARKIYEKTFSDLKRIEGTWEEKERRVNEHLPSQNLVRLRLASVAVKQRRYEDAHHYLVPIENDEFLSDSERVEKVNLSSIIAKERGETERAEAYLKTLTKTWQGKPDLLSETYLNLAKVQRDLRKFSFSEKSLNRAIALLKVSEKSEARYPQKLSKISNSLFNALQIKGDVLSKQEKSIAAVEVYTKLIEEFENKKPIGPLRYKIGKILFKKGDIKGAEEVWRKLNPEEHSMYLSLAREQIDHSQWEDDYHSYLKRIHSPTLLEILSQKGLFKNKKGLKEKGAH